MPSLTSLAEELLVKARQIDAYLDSKNLPPPNFDEDVLAELPPELQDVRLSLASTSHDLKNLTRGPVGTVSDILFGWTDLLPLRVIHHYRLATFVPITGSTTYASIAASAHLPEALVFRFLRAAMGTHLFSEDSAGRVRHTASSRLLATDLAFADAVGLQTEELGPAGTRVIDAWEKWGYEAPEPGQTGFALLHGEKPIFDVLAAEPERARRFGSAMHFYTKDEGWDLRHLLAAFDWAALDKAAGIGGAPRVVDVGGGIGSVSQFLARHTTRLLFEVQDLPHVIPGAQEALPKDLEGRVNFVAHSFLEPQAADSAPDVFLMRWVLHDWPDAYCVRILRALVPAMRAGVKVLLYEYVLADEPETDMVGRFGRQLDMIMAAAFNGKERRRKEYQALLEESDERYVLEAVRRPEGSTMSLVQVGWRG